MAGKAQQHVGHVCHVRVSFFLTAFLPCARRLWTGTFTQNNLEDEKTQAMTEILSSFQESMRGYERFISSSETEARESESQRVVERVLRLEKCESRSAAIGLAGQRGRYDHSSAWRSPAAVADAAASES